MATLDDKLLGEKMQNYCSSSSEDEGILDILDFSVVISGFLIN